LAVAATLRARLVGSACAAVLATSALAVTPQAYADHGGGGPSAGQVAASKARVARLERKVAAAADAVTRAQQSLDAARTAAEVAVEAFKAFIPPLYDPDTGGLADDVRAVLLQIVDGLTHSPLAGILPSLVEAAERDPELERLFKEFGRGRRAVLQAVFRRAAARGELRSCLLELVEFPRVGGQHLSLGVVGQVGAVGQLLHRLRIAVVPVREI